MVAYELGIHGIQVGWKVTPPPGVVFRTRTVPDGPLVTKPTDDRYRLVRPARQVAPADRAARGPQRLPEGEPGRAHLRTAGNVATKDAPLEVIGDPQKPIRLTVERSQDRRVASSPRRRALPEPARSRPASSCRRWCCSGCCSVSFVPAHGLARRVALDGRGALDRDRVAAAPRHPARAARGRLAAALLHAALGLDGRLRQRAGRDAGLSVAIALLAVPGGLWAGWSLFGRRAGLICAALCAVNPFLTAYAQETRMYSLMLVLSLLATAAFLHVFAFGRPAYLPVFSVLLALMLYTHNWGLFLGGGAGPAR